MIYSANLNLNLYPFREDFNFKNYKFPHCRISQEYLNSELYTFLKKRNLIITLAEFFYNPPDRKTTIHTDAEGGNYTKLNWVFGGTTSSMCWYKENISNSSIKEKTTIGTDYITYDPHNVSLISKATIKFPSIVQVGIPHNIINGNEERYCLSIVFFNSKNHRPTMEESLMIFHDLIDKD